MGTAVGYAALALLWLGLTLGIVLRDGRTLDLIRPATLAAIHQTMTACGLVLVLVHALTEATTPGAASLINLMIPFTHGNHPVGVGLGTLALELVVALVISALVRSRIGYHRWRVIHRFSYLAFALLLGHVLVMGLDRRPAWLMAIIALLGYTTIGFGLATGGWVARLPRRIPELMARHRPGQRIVINVDATRCVHFGFCQHEAPELFDVREDGRLEYAPTASRDQIEAAIRAARACPTRAIMLSQHAGRVVVAEPPIEPAVSDFEGEDQATSGFGTEESAADHRKPGDGKKVQTGDDGGRTEHVVA